MIDSGPHCSVRSRSHSPSVSPSCSPERSVLLPWFRGWQTGWSIPPRPVSRTGPSQPSAPTTNRPSWSASWRSDCCSAPWSGWSRGADSNRRSVLSEFSGFWLQPPRLRTRRPELPDRGWSPSSRWSWGWLRFGGSSTFPQRPDRAEKPIKIVAASFGPRRLEALPCWRPEWGGSFFQPTGPPPASNQRSPSVRALAIFRRRPRSTASRASPRWWFRTPISTGSTQP